MATDISHGTVIEGELKSTTIRTQAQSELDFTPTYNLTKKRKTLRERNTLHSIYINGREINTEFITHKQPTNEQANIKTKNNTKHKTTKVTKQLTNQLTNTITKDTTTSTQNLSEHRNNNRTQQSRSLQQPKTT